MSTLIIYSALLGFVIAVLLAPLLIPGLRRLKFGQNIREEGPKSHLSKAGTPTMGGIIFIISAVVATLVVRPSLNSDIVIILFALVGFGVIGFIDDYLKVVHKHNEGLKPLQKMVLLVGVSVIIALYAQNTIGTEIYIPFVNSTIDLGILFIPFMIVYYAATTNAVNLTDGLDGLATSITVLIATFFTLVAAGMGKVDVAIAAGALVGALLGFLNSNAFPAKVFMGDTGSLALGGVIAAIAMVLKLPLIILIVGGIYVIEAASVIIQVISFKTRGKRVFKMAPLHHHFEESGWHETRVVAVFGIITVILCLVGFLSVSI